MKPTTDPLDELIAAVLHGELTPEERTALDTRLQNDPAARAAYQESQLMHELLEKTHREAQPDPAFEQRMVSGVRRKIQHEAQHRETAWESAEVLWKMVKQIARAPWVAETAIACVVLLLVGLSMMGQEKRFVLLGGISKFAELSDYRAPWGQMIAGKTEDDQSRAEAGKSMAVVPGQIFDAEEKREVDKTDGTSRTVFAAAGQLRSGLVANSVAAEPNVPTSSSTTEVVQNAQQALQQAAAPTAPIAQAALQQQEAQAAATPAATTAASGFYSPPRSSGDGAAGPIAKVEDSSAAIHSAGMFQSNPGEDKLPVLKSLSAPTLSAPSVTTMNGATSDVNVVSENAVAATPAPVDTRKLIRNAQLDLEVKDYQAAVDKIAALTKSAGGYVDTSNSQRGGNGKLQGTVVVKILPENLDGFLLELRDLGELKNQSLSTEDVTKEYYDTQARLTNSQRMETQLQDLLKHTNGKVSELLQVERELGRVRGDIEQMQGELKLYDFQVQFATVTIAVAEKDLTQAAAYLLKENDQFSLFTTDVEAAFQQARHAADDFKAHILTANLNHNSGSDVSATLSVSVPPDQIEGFLNQVRSLGRVQNFTRQTERVARDGGDTNQPADETRTEKDRVMVQLSIQSDNQSQKQVAMTVVTSTVDDALDKAKAAALASAGAEILSSSLNKAPDGPATAQLSVRVPGKSYAALLEAFRGLGRTSAFSLQRDDNTGPNASDDDTPVTIALALTDDEAPLQQTELAVRSTEIDDKAQQLKKDAAAAGVEVKTSGFEHQPDGMEVAQMTFQMPMSRYAAFVEKLKELGHVDSLTVHREDRPGQGEDAPAEINFRIYSEGQIVADDNGLWANLRRTFGEGAQALFESVRTIGVVAAFLLPWVVLLGFAAWVGRRIYVARKK